MFGQSLTFEAISYYIIVIFYGHSLTALICLVTVWLLRLIVIIFLWCFMVTVWCFMVTSDGAIDTLSKLIGHVYCTTRNDMRNVTGCSKYRMRHMYCATRNDTWNVTGCSKFWWLWEENKVVAQNVTSRCGCERRIITFLSHFIIVARE